MPDDDELGPEKTPGLAFNGQGPNIGELVKTATSSYDDKPINELIDRVRDIPKREAAELDPMRTKFSATIDADQGEAQKKYKAISALDVQPWTQKPPENDPWKSFGSPGSVFAMIASAFTRTPMTNALNAGAASMNAVRAGDLNAYRSAFDAWKENTKLALERHDAQYKDYQAATDLYKTDVSAGDAAMRALSAKYGDEMTGVLREAGLQGELGKLWESRQKAAESMLEHLPAVEGFALRQEGYLGDPGRESPDAAVRAETYKKWFDPSYWHSQVGATGKPEMIALNQFIDDYKTAHDGESPTGPMIASFLATMKSPGAASRPENIAMKRFIEDHPDATADEMRDFAWSLKDKGPQEAQRLLDRDRALAEHRDRLAAIAENRNLTTAERAERLDAERALHNRNMEKIGQTRAENAGASSLAAAERQVYDKWKSEFKEANNREPSADEEQRKLADIRKGGLTGNKAAEYKIMVNQYETNMDKLDDVLGVLDNYLGAAGAPGYALRLKERVGNVVGSNDTDRVQFMRNLQLLRLDASRLLTNSNTRPLAAEANRINDIVAGLNLGDTTANTKRSLTELQTLYAKMRKNMNSILDGTWTAGAESEPTGAGGRPAASSSVGTQGSWNHDPVLGR